VVESSSREAKASPGPKSVRSLKIWREGLSLVKQTYQFTQLWPKAELYGLTAQARRAAVSVPVNLAEGLGRGTSAEMARYARMAAGSLYELDSLMEIAGELGLADREGKIAMQRRIAALLRQVTQFVRYHRSVANGSRSQAPTTNHQPLTTNSIAPCPA